MDDNTCIRRALKGDETALRALYERWYASVYRLAYLLLRQSQDAEEVTQDVFVYALSHLHSYDAARASFEGWLRIVTVSRCRNARRRLVPDLVSLTEMEAVGVDLPDRDLQARPEVAAELSSTRRALWAALGRVSPGARDALVLRTYAGLSYAEIGAALGCSEEAARSRVAHAKVQLRELLADERDEREGVLAPRRAHGSMVRVE